MVYVPVLSSTTVCVPESETVTGAVVAPAVATASAVVSAARPAIKLSFLNIAILLPVPDATHRRVMRRCCRAPLENGWQTAGAARAKDV